MPPVSHAQSSPHGQRTSFVTLEKLPCLWNQNVAVDYFYSATSRRSRGVTWSIFHAARTQIPGEGNTAQAQRPLLVSAGESITGSPIRFVGKETFVKLAAGSASCPISVLEDVSPPHHGPPLHSHDFEEFFYILSGEFLFEVNGELFRALPGDFVHAPSGIPHIFQNITDKEARMLLIVRPGGIEKYFAELAERFMTNPGDVPGLNAIGARYGITVLGPPIAARPRQ